MPKKTKEFVSSSSDSEQDEPQKKRSRDKKEAAKKPPPKETTDNSDGLMSLGSKKFVSVSEFKGKSYVNIREYYEKDGKMLPGKKGIALNSEQWSKLKDCMSEIDEQLDN